MKDYYRVEANIDLDAICYNIEETRKIINEDTKIMAIIKADGYGHGAIPIAKALGDRVDAYGVAILEEGIELRKAGLNKPILILGVTPEQEFRECIENDITLTVFEYKVAKKLSIEACKLNKKAKIHIKLDTGMSRIGFNTTDNSVNEVCKINELEGIVIDGIFTHFACADEADKSFTNIQIKRYLEFVEKLEQRNVIIPIKHISNSAGIIEFPEANLNMVRSGISTYGLYPSNEVDKSKLVLKPAMEIKTDISYIKEVEVGTGVSYGSTFITKRKTKIATIPVGYADGYKRQLSSIGRVLIHGKSANIIGRVCMDQFMVDITDIKDVKVGDTVTLVGRDGNENITVEELADKAGSFNYEFVCDISKRIPRVFYRNGKKVGTQDYYDCLDETLLISL